MNPVISGIISSSAHACEDFEPHICPGITQMVETHSVGSVY